MLKAEHRLLAELNNWRGKLKAATNKKSTTEIDLWNKRIAQKLKQLEDNQVNAENYDYVESVLQDGKGTKRTALEELIRWRLWNRTGGGLMAELGSHQLDASGIFISADWNNGHKALPLSVVGVGGRHVFPADRDVDDHVYCTFEYPGKGYYKDFDTREIGDENKKIVVTYSSINGNGYGGHGETVYGTKGTIILAREKEAMLFKGSATTSRVKVGKGDAVLDTTDSGPSPAAAMAKAAYAGDISRGYTEEIEHWAWCIRNRDPENQPRCHPDVALADAVIALTTNIAIEQKRRIEFKPEWFDKNSDETPEGVKPRDV